MYMSRKTVIVSFLALLFCFNACKVEGQAFMNRLEEGTNELGWSNALFYAGSIHSLQTFMNRLEEGTNELGWSNALFYARSTHSLK